MILFRFLRIELPHKGAFDDEFGGFVVGAFRQAAVFKQGLGVAQHVHRAADHAAVDRRVEWRHSKVLEQFSGLDEIRDPAPAWKIFPGDRCVMHQLVFRELANERVVDGLLNQIFAVFELSHFPAGVCQYHLVELLVGIRVTDQAGKRGDPGAGREHVDALSGNQGVVHQSAGRLFSSSEQRRLAGFFEDAMSTARPAP